MMSMSRLFVTKDGRIHIDLAKVEYTRKQDGYVETSDNHLDVNLVSGDMVELRGEDEKLFLSSWAHYMKVSS